MSELVKVTINGSEFEAEEGTPLIDVCNKNGFGVPSFCYYSDLELQASCRMCLVRIDKMPKLQASCSIPVRDGMVVTTQSEEIEKTQRAMGEFLLANHPLDCPVCDRGGECELQEIIFDWGDVEERFRENKNAHPEKFLSPIVANDQQRCILCKRCTRVCHEWMGEDVIEAGNRGASTVIGTYGGWLNCSQCGNCVEVCPTGTLLDGVYRHSTRPWELDQTVSTDTYSSDGMQLSIGSRAGEVHRIVARDRYVNGLNGEFLDVKARFAHEFINSADRIKTPLIRYKKDGKLIPATWDEAVSHVADKFREAGKVGVVASPRLTNESVFLLRRFAEECGKGDFAVSDKCDVGEFMNNLSAPLTTHKAIRHASVIVVIGGEPEEEQTFTAKQIRQAVRNGGARLFIANETPIRLTDAAEAFVHLAEGSTDAFVLGLFGGQDVSAKTGAAQSEIEAVKKAIEGAEGDVIIIAGGELSSEALAAISSSAGALGTDNRKIKLQLLAPYNNSIGAHDMMPNAKTVGAVVSGSKALLIAGSLQDASVLEGADFVVVQEMFETETTAKADVVLPAASFAESDGTYTNNTGFVQRVRKAIDPVHQSKPDWMITSAIAVEMGKDFGYQMSASAVFKSIADKISAYEGLRYPALKDESNPASAKYPTNSKQEAIKALEASVANLPEGNKKNDVRPEVGHKLHRLTTMTSRTKQFHLLANGNPKPEDLHVSPLEQFELDGTPKANETPQTETVEASSI
ncbi:MAG: molybdopterin-dependent oxidoreductase [Pyrinomonadaceae bacterium]